MFALDPIGGKIYWIEQTFGLYLAIGLPTQQEFGLMAAILALACLVGTLPALRAYRQSLIDGMTARF